jgi:hypothetical protein
MYKQHKSIGTSTIYVAQYCDHEYIYLPMSRTFLWASNRFLKEKHNDTDKLPIAKKNK